MTAPIEDVSRLPGKKICDQAENRVGEVKEIYATNLLRRLQLVPADIDRVARGVVDPADGDDVRRAFGAGRCEPTQLPSAGQVANFCLMLRACTVVTAPTDARPTAASTASTRERRKREANIV
jgi:hypothetical protein